jgi:hypothetical protein
MPLENPPQTTNLMEDVMTTNNTSLYSTMVRSGRTTYFVDLKEAKNGNKYLSICESKIDGEDKKRVTVRVFGESIGEFKKAVEDAAAAIPQ